MTITFPKKQKTLIQNHSFRDLIVAISKTVDSHLQFVDDAVTLGQWNDLVYNGIRNHDSLTVSTVARILNITDKTDMEIGKVIPELFRSIPVIKD